MNSLVIIGGLLLLSFGLVYIRPGRFGPAVVALAAGYVLAVLWAGSLSEYSLRAGIQFGSLPTREILHGGLTLIPGVFVLVFGQKKQGLIPRIVAAAVAAVLVLALLLPLLPADSQSQAVYGIIKPNRELIITVGLIVGLFDMVFSRVPKPSKHGKD